MQGSLEEWIERGGPTDESMQDQVVLHSTECRDAESTTRRYPVRSASFTNIDSVIDYEEMLNIIRFSGSAKRIILDSRGSSFVKQGHMPGAIHIPYKSLSDERSTVRLKKKADLMETFRMAGVDPLDSSTTIVCTCGSGVSACSLYLALFECGRREDGREPSPKTRVYDGSWQEWSLYSEAPKVGEL
jgi:thiosulfate/3-mercaptopyruvate sulfurtransferase